MWIDGFVAVVIVPHDVVEIDGLRNSGILKQLTRVRPQVRIVDNPAAITFEMQMIDRVEPDQSREKTPIRFGDLIANQIALL